MGNSEFSQKKVIVYLIAAFGIAYAVQFYAAGLYSGGNKNLGMSIIAVMMFVPAVSVLIAKGNVRDLGWKPQVRKNARCLLAAWFGPAILAAIGAALYFLLFPGHFDLSGEYLKLAGGDAALEQMSAQGISYPMYVLINAAGAMTYAPLLNAIAALGEEIGWRGFLYPQLKSKFGTKHGWILAGVIWGMWHWPLIALIGYEYGEAAGNAAGYAGDPISGMLMFCVSTAGLGILHAWLYEKSGTIWAPAIFHGAFNAIATIAIAICLPNTGTARLLGPAPVGLISGLPILIAAAVILGKKEAA